MIIILLLFAAVLIACLGLSKNPTTTVYRDGVPVEVHVSDRTPAQKAAGFIMWGIAILTILGLLLILFAALSV